MNRRTNLVLALVASICFLGLAIWFFNRNAPPKEHFLRDEDVESVVAETFSNYGDKGVSSFQIPAEYVPRILDAIRPIVENEYPPNFDEPLLGKLTIHKRDHTRVEITFPMCGQGPLFYKYNGVRCGRGGPYEPVFDIVHEGVRMGYADESLMLVGAIEEIGREAAGGKKSTRLVRILEDLERSAGKRPPQKQ